MSGLIDDDDGLKFGTGLIWLSGGLGGAGLVIVVDDDLTWEDPGPAIGSQAIGATAIGG